MSSRSSPPSSSSASRWSKPKLLVSPDQVGVAVADDGWVVLRGKAVGTAFNGTGTRTVIVTAWKVALDCGDDDGGGGDDGDGGGGDGGGGASSSSSSCASSCPCPCPCPPVIWRTPSPIVARRAEGRPGWPGTTGGRARRRTAAPSSPRRRWRSGCPRRKAARRRTPSAPSTSTWASWRWSTTTSRATRCATRCTTGSASSRTTARRRCSSSRASR